MDENSTINENTNIESNNDTSNEVIANENIDSGTQETKEVDYSTLSDDELTKHLEEMIGQDNEVAETEKTEEDNTEEKQETVEDNTQEELSDKIQIGDKEYTKDELESLINGEEQRTEEVITNDYSLLMDNQTSDLVVMSKKYIALASMPTALTINEEGDQIEVPNPDILTDALVKGNETGDYTEFIQYLNPVDVQNFLNEKSQIDEYYKPYLNDLTKEYQDITSIKQKNEDIKQWDSWLNENKVSENPQEVHIFNYLKSKYNFNPEQQKEFLKVIREANNKLVNSKILTEETDKMKLAMKSSTIPSKNTVKDTGFTMDDLQKMSSDDFDKNFNKIMKQAMNGGF